MKGISDEIKVELTALSFYYTYFISEEGFLSQDAARVMGRVGEIQEKNNISDDEFAEIAITVPEDKALMEEVEKRYNELVKKGLR